MPLLKTASDLLAQGQDLVARGDFGGATQRYAEAAKRFTRDGELRWAAVAQAYAAVMGISARVQDPNAYRTAVQFLQPLGDIPLKIGLHEVPASALARESDLVARELELRTLAPTNPQGFDQKAHALQALSADYRVSFTGQVLVLPELFHQGSTTGEQRATVTAALSEEAMGESLVNTDPKSAAEHYQNARLWWSQAGDSVSADAALARVTSYSRGARCWFCGREVSGEGIHFVAMPSELTDLVMQRAGDSPIPSFDASRGVVYACRGCEGAIYRMADSLATQRTKELEARVQTQIEQLKQQISAIRSRLGMGGL